MCISDMFKKCLLSIYDIFLVKRCFSIKVVCLTDGSPKFVQEKTTELIFWYMLFLQSTLLMINDVHLFKHSGKFC